jgi:predicted metalloendopeptidase
MVDRSVRPADDFFAYANGNWLKTARIPDDRSYAGVNLEINLRNEERLKAILADLGARPDGALTPEERKLRDLFAAFTDTVAIEAHGMGPARADLAAIAGLTTREQIAEAMSDPALQLDGPFGFDIGADDKNPEAYALRLYQSGLGLPDRDYYLRDDDELKTTRAAYGKYLATMLRFAGVGDADRRAWAVMALETELARAHWPAAERRDA